MTRVPPDFGRSSSYFPTLCVALLSVLAALPVQAQSRPPASAGTAVAGIYRVAGTVVNSVTGEPVRGATVGVLTLEDSSRIGAAQSSNDGRFSIGGLAAGKYQLTASKRGYSTAFYDEHELFSSAVVTGAGQDTGNFVFRLVPGTVLRGVVTGDGGDPVAGAQVMLFAKPIGHAPGERITETETAVTDDTGAYEFSNLRAGEYFLAVKAEPWYAMHHASRGSRRGTASPANAALDVAFPITYFDSTTEEASASPIVLAGGSRMEADVSLHAVPAVHLQVDAPRKPDGSVARPELKQYIFGREVSAESAGVIGVVQTGGAEFTGVAPGQYELTQGDPPRAVEIDANTSQQVDPGVGVPTVAVSGTLQTANGGPFTGAATVSLEPADGAQGLKPLEAGFNRGAFSFAAVPAGTWKLRAESSGLLSSVLSIAIGGRVHSGNLVTVADRPLTLVAKLNAGGVRVEGMARKDGKGVAGIMVLLVPKDPAAFPESVRRDQTDSDGSFAVRDTAPGQYTLLAIEEGWALDWTRPEVIARYLPGGIAVTVTDTLDKVVRIATPIQVQMR
jgi:uncharacterized surface anchored protein